MTIPAMLWGAVLLSMLGFLSWIDIRSLRLPDVLTLPLLAAGLIQSWLLSGEVIHAIIGAGAGYLVFVLVETGFRALRGKEGLGRGDAKLLAAGGAWCGWMGLPWIVLIASSSGLVIAGVMALILRRVPGMLPFGPFLALGIASVWFSRALSLFF